MRGLRSRKPTRFRWWVVHHSINIYGTKKLTLPTPRFFLIYTGDSEIENVLTLKTKEELFKALQKTMDYCINHDILKDFLLSHRKEALDFMISIFTEEQLRAMEKKEDFEEGLEKGLEKGREEGLEQGKVQTSLMIAKKMKEEGLSIQLIVKLTNLKEEQIFKL